MSMTADGRKAWAYENLERIERQCVIGDMCNAIWTIEAAADELAGGGIETTDLTDAAYMLDVRLSELIAK